jgi:hypothetical protein
MRDEYDFSKATRGHHAEELAIHGYRTRVRHKDGTETVTEYPPKHGPDERTQLAGKEFLLRNLRTFDVKMAKPVNDPAIDLFVYGMENGARKLDVCPVALNASTGERIYVRSHDEEIPHLLLAFVWHALEDKKEIYAVPFGEMRRIFIDRGYAAGRCYQDVKGWTIEQPDDDLRRFMEEHRITSGEQWLTQMRAALGQK